MANNTDRRLVYLPPELDKWFMDHSEETGIKINTLIVDALVRFKDGESKSGKKQQSDFNKKVRRIIEAYLAENGYDKL